MTEQEKAAEAKREAKREALLAEVDRHLATSGAQLAEAKATESASLIYATIAADDIDAVLAVDEHGLLTPAAVQLASAVRPEALYVALLGVLSPRAGGLSSPDDGTEAEWDEWRAEVARRRARRHAAWQAMCASVQAQSDVPPWAVHAAMAARLHAEARLVEWTSRYEPPAPPSEPSRCGLIDAHEPHPWKAGPFRWSCDGEGALPAPEHGGDEGGNSGPGWPMAPAGEPLPENPDEGHDEPPARRPVEDTPSLAAELDPWALYADEVAGVKATLPGAVELADDEREAMRARLRSVVNPEHVGRSSLAGVGAALAGLTGGPVLRARQLSGPEAAEVLGAMKAAWSGDESPDEGEPYYLRAVPTRPAPDELA
jgi:hypothetical protein